MNFYDDCRPRLAMNNQFPIKASRAGMDVIEAAKLSICRFAWTTPIALPTYPQQMQTQQLLDLKDKASQISHALT